jgi:uracil-DNA glycosylase
VFDDIVRETGELVKRAAHAKRGTVSLSPEVAAALEALGPGMPEPQPVAPKAAPAASEPYTGPGLDALHEQVAACTQCPLSETRTQTVFGAGDPKAGLVFVGEAPGADEDRQGEPFVGAAGKLLTTIIEKGIGMSRSEVYICNVLKCRPPKNRDPRPDEVELCEPFLVRQLAAIRPKVICALGGHAAKTLLKTTESIGRLRGKWHFYQGIPVRVTYHPAYLLHCQDDPTREKREKGKVWADIQEVMKVLKGEIMPSPGQS